MRPYAPASGPSSGCELPADERAASTSDGHFRHLGVDRDYSLVVSAGPEPAPLVVSLHGASATNVGHDLVTRFPQLADAEGFTLLSPEALEPGRVWDITPGEGDTTYVLALLDRIQSEACIDEGRVYLAGFSMGAMLATSLSCIRPGRFAAVAAVSGLADVRACQDPERRRSPLIAFQGADDDLIMADGRYSGLVRTGSGLDNGPSRLDLAAAWAESFGCESTPAVTEEPPVTSTRFTCAGGAQVVFHLVHGSDHHWPGGDPGYTTPVAPEGEPDATRMIWDFFEAQPT